MECVRCATCYRGALEVGRISIAANCALTIAIVFIECLFYSPCLPSTIFILILFNYFSSHKSLIAVHPTIYFLCLPYLRRHLRPNNTSHLYHLLHNKFPVSIYAPYCSPYASHNSPGYLLVLYIGNACQPSPMRLI